MTRNILFIMTGAGSWTLNDGTAHKTGFWAEEAVAPLEVFRAAGYRVTVATPNGVQPPVDETSLAVESIGTPERAARTLHELCGGCCGLPERVRDDYDALIEWLRGDT